MENLYLEKIVKDFSDGRENRRVLFDTTLTLHPGELTVLAGPSGSGKTTLLSIMGLVLSPTEGRIVFRGKDLTRLSDEQAAHHRFRDYGFVFQQPMLLEGLSILENVLLAVGVQGRQITREDRERATGLLQAVGLEQAMHMQPRLLSGGMKQRASIARALIKNPPIVLCDEPTSSLDAESGRNVIEILKRIATEEKRIIVVVSHDARVFPFADRLIKLENGRIVADTRPVNHEALLEEQV
ncbi:MAG: ABC transporter ATP-binding protein [Candidatus Sumerlaeaceae bacterium]|jgi:putative ABC transport system ATP-binding protein